LEDLLVKEGVEGEKEVDRRKGNRTGSDDRRA